MKIQKKKAVCLFSGGLDSTTVLYMASELKYQVTALTIQYGQSHSREIDCARSIAADLGVEHYVTSFALPWGGSSLLGNGVEIPKNRTSEVMIREIPSTYVPARNIIFLSLAASLAEATGAGSLFIGANAIDYSGYPDCRPEFLESFSQALSVGTKSGSEGDPFTIEAPLLRMTKKEIILTAVSLGVPLEKTWSCYAGEKRPCGVCDSCILRRKGFEEAGITDPLDKNEISSQSR